MSTPTLSPVDQVRDHLCAKGLFGDVTEMCEMRGDCVWVVTCPDCRMTFALDDDEYDELLSWSQQPGQTCGVAS